MTIKTLVSYALIVLLGLSFLTPTLTTAATTNPWDWTDISGQVQHRTNRPIWSIAYANGYWFYTDGVEFSNGGQVYRYDGISHVNITDTLRDRGMTRVDDIVSDNSNTVMFLQDIVRYDNTLRLVAYQSGAYTDRTSTIRNTLATNEGLTQLIGENGTWYYLTTKGRLYRWNGVSSPTVVSFPSEVQNVISRSLPVAEANRGTYPLRYKIRKNIDLRTTMLAMFPVSGSTWMLYAHDVTTSGADFYTYNGTSFVRHGQLAFEATDARTAISNGEDLLLTTEAGRGTSMDTVYGYVTKYTLTGNRKIQFPISVTIPRKNENLYPTENTQVFWNGSSWMIYNGDDRSEKTLHRLDHDMSYLGGTHDYFVTGAGDGQGRLLLGGAVSAPGTNGPTSPLTAKLVMVAESGLGTFTPPVNNTPNTTTQDSGTGISRWEWLTPNVSSFRNSERVTYGIGAWDADGLRRIEIYVHGNLVRTCSWSIAYGNQECTYELDARNYNQNTNILVNARVTDAGERSVWTDGRTVRRDIDSAYHPGNNVNSGNVAITSWFDRELTYRADSVRFAANGWATYGLNRIELYVNGSQIRTCSYANVTGNQICDFTLYGGSYSAGTQIAANAKAIDRNGGVAWSEVRYLTIPNASSAPYIPPISDNEDPTVWDWLSPDMTSIRNTETATYGVGAWDADGLTRIEIYVNDTTVRTCTLGMAYGNQECTFTIEARRYSQNTNLMVNARATDARGRTRWTTGKTIRRDYDNGSPQNPYSPPSNSGSTPTMRDWMNPNTTSVTDFETVRYYAGATDLSGVETIEMFVDGIRKHTCRYTYNTNERQCWVEFKGLNYSNGQRIFVNARATDFQGNATWSTGRTVTAYNSYE